MPIAEKFHVVITKLLLSVKINLIKSILENKIFKAILSIAIVTINIGQY